MRHSRELRRKEFEINDEEYFEDEKDKKQKKLDEYTKETKLVTTQK